MLSRVEGKKYIILVDEESRFPEKIGKTRTDRLLSFLRRHMQAVVDEMEKIERLDPALYRLVTDRVFGANGYVPDDHTYFRSRIDNIDSLVEQLKSDDEIPKEEEVILPEDFGFRQDISEKGYYTKILEDTDEREVVEEIIARPGLVLRRVRTIEWEKTDYGRSSKSIAYRKKPIGKRLMRAIENATARNEARIPVVRRENGGNRKRKNNLHGHAD